MKVIEYRYRKVGKIPSDNLLPDMGWWDTPVAVVAIVANWVQIPVGSGGPLYELFT